ncbi:Cyclin-dependent kinase catalytic subunit [Rhodotorula mucilaginosa]|uniref:Cyclin-dependent kinase 1 n=1 Tax=Rhodotorula mucilaginosa TaxID=5537 RepID=A0A9P6WAB3_RHOMI|nr:Cyclin-dependent kinase catalytic subunit [Rhodotorula mucilaginosa]
MENYERLEKVGEGTYGTVYKCRQLQTGHVVALKKIRLEEEDEGVPSTALREVSVLMELGQSTHQGAECIVKLLDVIHGDESLSLVFEFLDLDLKRYMDTAAIAAANLASSSNNALGHAGGLDANGQWVPQAQMQPLPHNVVGRGRSKRALPPDLVMKFMAQLLLGLSHLHSRRILHRDLKPQNIMIDKQGNLKVPCLSFPCFCAPLQLTKSRTTRVQIADFGLARTYGVPLRTYTHEIITLWYRPLEVLLGGRHYTTAVDVWSCATIFAEMASGLPLVPGDSEIDQIFKIFRLMGTPTVQSWPGLAQMPDNKQSFPKWQPADLRKLLPEMDERGLHLLNSMLQIDPERRISGPSLSSSLPASSSLPRFGHRLRYSKDRSTPPPLCVLRAAKSALRHPYFHPPSSSPNPNSLAPPPLHSPLGHPLSPLFNSWGSSTTLPAVPSASSSSHQQFAPPASHHGPGAAPGPSSHYSQAQAHAHAHPSHARHGSDAAMHDSPVAPMVPRGEGLMASPMR